MKLPAASGEVSKWIHFYIFTQISRSRREAFFQLLLIVS
jgi:hypothetical protein